MTRRPDGLMVGIDPGREGYLAAVNPLGAVQSFRLPYLADDDRHLDPVALRRLVMDLGDIRLAVLERPGVRPTDGRGRLARSHWNAGQVYGVLAGLCVHTILPTPQEWKRAILADSFPHDKAGAVAYVMATLPYVNLTPGRKKTPDHNLADALCLASFGLAWLDRKTPRKTPTRKAG